MKQSSSKVKDAESKPMGLITATSIGVGAMIGAGIFALVGISVDIAGDAAFISFLIAGLLALFTSYSVSKLATVFPSKGGPVVFLNKAFGSGIISGTLNIQMWLGYIIVTSLYAKAFGEYFVAIIGQNGNSLLMFIIPSSIIVLFTVINFIGAKLTGRAELILVALKVLILLGFVVIGVFSTSTNEINLNTSEIDIYDIIIASGVIFMAYEGFGLIANTAEDLKNPKRNLPKAFFISIGIVIFTYVLVTLVVLKNLSINEILEAKEYVLAEATKPMFGEIGFEIMGIAALLSTASAINATIYGPVNMVQETSKANQLPNLFSKKLFGHHSGTALIITTAIVLVITATLSLDKIAKVGSLTFLMIYTAVNISNYKLYKITNSNRLISIIGVLGTSFAFITLVYYQIKHKSLSLFVFIALFIICFLFEYIYQKIQRSKLIYD